MATHRDSYSILREELRWRVALVLGVMIVVLMVALGSLNTRLGLADTAELAWWVLAASSACVVGLLLLPRGVGGTLFFLMIVATLLVVPAFGLYHGRNMQHWAYIFPAVIIFLMRPGPGLLAIVAYGVYVSWATARLLPAIEVVRFASGYGLLICFMYTYALLQERAAAMLRYHSERDALTNCFNRRTFNEAIERLATEASATVRRTFLLIDIDYFKAINDEHGHLVGDRIITQVAAELGRHLAADTPLYRYGGEEFAVILGQDDEDAAARLAERLRAAVANADFQGVRVTVSIGIATWRSALGSVSSAIGHADRRLYEAKRAGRNRVVAPSTPLPKETV